MASKRAREQRAAAPARGEQLGFYNYCEPKRAGMARDCFGRFTVHEPWTRGRGGPLGDPRNMITACVRHNDELQQTSDGIEFAYAHGYLVRAADGPTWLAAGGFVR